MKISLPKLKAIFLYFGTYTNKKYLGKVKLMKLFYFLDFCHLKKYGAPITYDNYVNLEHGPIPSGILNLVNSAVYDIDNSVLTDTITFEKKEGTDMCRVSLLREFNENDKKHFSITELEILEKICQRFAEKNTKFIEEASHKESPWKCTALLQTIAYTLATNDDDCVATKEEIELLLKI